MSDVLCTTSCSTAGNGRMAKSWDKVDDMPFFTINSVRGAPWSSMRHVVRADIEAAMGRYHGPTTIVGESNSVACRQ